MPEQTLGELQHHLDDQTYYLHRSMEAAAIGNTREAKALAGPLRILLQGDGCLLEQLHYRRSWRWLDTAGDRGMTPHINTWWTGLTFLHMAMEDQGGTTHVPRLDELDTSDEFVRSPGECISFDDWWEAPIIFDAEAGVHTRREIVLRVANKDGGGGHVDGRDVQASYYALTRFNTSPIANLDKGGPTGIELATLHQIAHEVRRTVEANESRFWLH